MYPSIDEGPRLARNDPNAGPTPVVVLLHGQPGTAADWYRVVPLLSADHRVIAVDRPGYCGEPSEARDWDGNADVLLAMLDRLQLNEVVLVAASWAGGVAVEAARRAPTRITGIVFAAAVGGKGAITWFDRVIAWRPIRSIGARIAPHTGVSLARPFWWVLGSHLDEQAVREARLSLAVWRERRVWTAAAIEQRYLVRDHEKLTRHVAELNVPSIVLQGTHDLTVPLEAGVQLAAAIPHAELVKPDAGHMLAFEEPVAVAAAVRQLTGRVQERRAP